MGAKKLKAIAVKGSQPTAIARPEELQQSIRELLTVLTANT